jgi:hypothetical protein
MKTDVLHENNFPFKPLSVSNDENIQHQEDSWYTFLLEVESTQPIVGPEGLCQLKNPAASRIKPATFRFVA